MPCFHFQTHALLAASAFLPLIESKIIRFAQAVSAREVPDPLLLD